MGIHLMIYRRGLKKLISLPVQSLRRRGSRETIVEHQQLSKGEATPVNQMKQISIFAVGQRVHALGSKVLFLVTCAFFNTQEL